jgi:hypothetical protein
MQQSSGGPANTIQREPDDAPVHPAQSGGNRAGPNNVPIEKWSEQIEQQYRMRGDLLRANAVRACRTKGGDACAILLTASETMRLHALAKESAGDEAKIKVGMASAAPLLAPRVLPTIPRVIPHLRLLPPLPPPAPAPVAGAGLAAGTTVVGVAAIVAICAVAGYQLWQLGKFQDELRAKGFIILEDPLGLCISGCHMPSKQRPFPSFDEPGPLKPFKPMTDRELEEWLGPKGSQPKPGPVAPPVPQVGPRPGPRRHPDQTCENDVLDKLQKKKDDICNSIPGESCSPSKVSPKRLARRPCSQIRVRIQSVRDCLKIRQDIQDTCFGGKPDPVHLKVMKELNDGLAHCVALAAINCAPGHPMANL